MALTEAGKPPVFLAQAEMDSPPRLQSLESTDSSLPFQSPAEPGDTPIFHTPPTLGDAPRTEDDADSQPDDSATNGDETPAAEIAEMAMSASDQTPDDHDQSSNDGPPAGNDHDDTGTEPPDAAARGPWNEPEGRVVAVGRQGDDGKMEWTTEARPPGGDPPVPPERRPGRGEEMKEDPAERDKAEESVGKTAVNEGYKVSEYVSKVVYPGVPTSESRTATVQDHSLPAAEPTGATGQTGDPFTGPIAVGAALWDQWKRHRENRSPDESADTGDNRAEPEASDADEGNEDEK
jgi:hypothetical protein